MEKLQEIMTLEKSPEVVTLEQDSFLPVAHTILRKIWHPVSPKLDLDPNQYSFRRSLPFIAGYLIGCSTYVSYLLPRLQLGSTPEEVFYDGMKFMASVFISGFVGAKLAVEISGEPPTIE